MYTAYFGLNENPFSLTPDPRFLFMSQRHREALAHLLYGMSDKGGFVLLTGEVGTGKTTLCRSLLDQVPEGVEVALVLNPKQSALELVASLCDELKITYPAGTDSLKVLIDRLNRHLLDIHARGRRTVLIIDEAQNLSIDVLEQVRLLTNLETTTRKLLQILLIGQPELQIMMAQPELRQIGQRITARYHLSPLLPDETVAYVNHRLEVAGCKRRLFTKGSLGLAHTLSGGIPRLINTICDRALLGAYAQQVERVDRQLLRKAASEVMGPKLLGRPRRLFAWALALWACVLVWAGWQFIVNPMIEKQAIMSEHGPPTALSPASPKGPKPQPQNLKKEGAKAPASGPSAETGEKPLTSEPRAEATKVKEEKADAPDVLAELLLTGTAKTDMDTAFAALLKQWQAVDPPLPGMTPCERVAKIGLRCYRDKGNWTTLRHLNRPVILELIDRDQRRHHVAAIRMKEHGITLDLGAQQVTLNQSAVEPFWFGDFTLLWKPPALSFPVIKEGDRGPDVLWLRAQLDRAEDIQFADANQTESQAPSPSPLFDQDLKRRVMEFQRANFVRADGIVGEQTLIQLNKATAGAAIPLLYTRPTNGEKHVVDP
ncbi:MAG: AAA family ATPase [Candidatus Desulfacyla sp.]